MEKNYAEQLSIYTQVSELNANWKLFSSAPNEFLSIESAVSYYQTTNRVKPAPVPGTVAMAQASDLSNPWQSIDQLKHLDSKDWWYFTEFEVSNSNKKAMQTLQFDGLATLAEVYLNGEKILEADNMFRGFSVDVSDLINKKNQLAIVFRSQQQALSIRKTRPRWKTKLVNHQQMRWLRTTVLGSVDVWTPPITAIGPWKAIRFMQSKTVSVKQINVVPQVENLQSKLLLKGSLSILDSVFPKQACKLVLSINNQNHEIPYQLQNSNLTFNFEQTLQNIQLWWPHTHGEPKCYTYSITLKIGEDSFVLKQGHCGFKTTEFNHQTSTLNVNKTKVFCRGTCWTTNDYLSLNPDHQALRSHLQKLVDAGVNMIRVGGTMVYESDTFYNLCNELGVMVWHDFMFASMDYPFDDEHFSQNAKAEINYQLSRITDHPCITVFCGNTDVAAQAAMYGIDQSLWEPEFFKNWLQQQCNQTRPDIPYFSSSPSGGVMPFHLDQGISHYWGVGAYMHDLPDIDTQRVKFSSEGMGLSHIPDQQTIEEVTGKNTLYPYSNAWAERVPRDLGAGWDFEDIREKYTTQIFNIDPIVLKRSDVNQYMQLSKLATGIAIADVFNQWRGYQSQCNGGLIWFNQDFWPCAGFGIIDSSDIPKPAYYLVAQKWKSQALLINHQGLNGSFIKIINEKPTELNAQLKIILIKNNDIFVDSTTQEINIPSHDFAELSLESLFGRFLDSAYAYQFGPKSFDLIYASIEVDDQLIDETFSYVSNIKVFPLNNSNVEYQINNITDTGFELEIVSKKLLQFVEINIKGFLPKENYFHIAPNSTKKVFITAENSHLPVTKIKGTLSALNLNSDIKIKANLKS